MRILIAILSAFAVLTSVSAPARAYSAADGWDLLAGAVYAEVGDGADWRVDKTFPADVSARDGGWVTLSGYVAPLTSEQTITDLVLLRDRSDDPFHGDPVRVVEVKLEAPARLAEGDFVRLRGRLILVADADTIQLFRMEAARPIGPDPTV